VLRIMANLSPARLSLISNILHDTRG
jgi:hypothetical protein